MTTKFDGFREPDQNWSRLPHQFIEALPIIESQGEMAVILYVLRHTWGYGDDDKRITLDEFQHGRKRRDGSRIDSGTGMSRTSILRGIEKAVSHGFLEVEEDNSDLARQKRFYSLRLNQMYRIDTPDVSNRYPGGSDSIHRSEKETSRKKPERDTSIAQEPSGFNLEEEISSMLALWAELFPEKTQPRPATVAKKVRARLGDPDFRDGWRAALRAAASSPHLHRSSWFQFSFFVRNDENWIKCRDRFYASFDDALAQKANGAGPRLRTSQETQAFNDSFFGGRS